MPIRMVEDNPGRNNRRKKSNNNGRRRSGGSGIIGMLLPLLIRNPKLMVIAAVLFGVFYLFNQDTASSVVSSAFNTGMEIKPEEYKKAEIYAPLSDNKKNPMPSKKSLLKYAPSRLNQGGQGSCVGWASSYAARTILYSKQTGQNPNNVKFSPSSLYNEIHLADCQGAYVHTAMKTMKEQGVLPFVDFPYDDNSCSQGLNNSQLTKAKNFTIKGYNRLTKGSNRDNLETDLLAIKQNLVQGAPVVIGMMVGGSFMQSMNGKSFWYPTASDYQQYGFGGHALCVIGYDDFKEGGAFQIMNSWGEKWGDKGIFWISYDDFAEFNKEAYGLFPMGDANNIESKILALEFGLVLNKNKQNISLTQKDKFLFQTTNAINIGDKFKIEVTNNATCYTYVFGQETDKSSYVLFPYTKKHSPYCGIVGTRLFPSDFSLQADDIGSKDFMAVLVTKQPIDYDKINQAINKTEGDTYYEKVMNTFGDNLFQTDFTTSTNILFEGSLEDNKVVAIVLEINKVH